MASHRGHIDVLEATYSPAAVGTDEAPNLTSLTLNAGDTILNGVVEVVTPQATSTSGIVNFTLAGSGDDLFGTIALTLDTNPAGTFINLTDLAAMQTVAVANAGPVVATYDADTPGTIVPVLKVRLFIVPAFDGDLP